MPELIQGDCTPARVAEEAASLLTDAARHAAMREALGAVREKLSLPGASARAAAAVIETVRQPAQVAWCLGRQAHPHDRGPGRRSMIGDYVLTE